MSAVVCRTNQEESKKKVTKGGSNTEEEIRLFDRNATIFSTIMKITFEEIDGIFLLFLTTAATRYSANL